MADTMDMGPGGDRPQPETIAAPGMTTTQTVAHSYSENVKHSRTNFFVLLLAQLYCLITIETTQDAALLSNSTTQNLPILETSISIETFYILAPAILLIIFFHFQIHLKSFWVSSARSARAEGRNIYWLVDTYPWFITTALTRQFADRRSDGFGGLFEYWAGLLFGWFSTAIILFMMWARFLTKKDWVISILHVGLVSIAIAGAFYFLYSAKSGVQGKEVRGWRALSRGTTVTLAFAIPFVMLSYATWWLFEAQDRSRCQANIGSECSAIFLIRERLQSAGLDPSASLEGVDVSTRPEGWFPTPESGFERLASVRGANLRAEDLRYASANDALFVRADLRGANLRFGSFAGAWFQGADMNAADLSFSNFAGAHFDHADLTQASFTSADVSGASFFTSRLIGATGEDLLAVEASFQNMTAQNCSFMRADFRKSSFTESAFTLCTFEATQFDGATMDRARFSGTRFTDVDFNETSLIGAELVDSVFRDVRAFRAQLKSVDLFRAQIENTRIEEANLEDALLSEARISRSSLRDSVLRRVDLRRATFEDVNLSGADLSGALLFGARFSEVDMAFVRFGDADLSGADLSGAVNLRQEQLAAACGDPTTQLPAGITLTSCAERNAGPAL